MDRIEKRVEKGEDRRVRRTRAQLRDAFTALLREKPVDEITVRELTDLADVNRGTFYGHYRDIYDLLEQMEGEALGEFAALMDRYSSSDLRGGLLPILTDVFHFVEKHGGLCAALLSRRGDNLFFQQLSTLIDRKCLGEWQELYCFAGEEQRAYCMDFLVAGAVELVRGWVTRGFAEPAEDMAALTERLILRGMSTFAAER